MQEFASHAFNTIWPLRDSFLVTSQNAALILLTAIWQGALVASCLAISLKLVPRTEAAHRFIIWAVGFAIVLCLPFLVILPCLWTSVAPTSATGITSVSIKPWFQWDARWSIALTALWAAAFLVRAADLVIHSTRLRKLWKAAVPVNVETNYADSLSIRGRRMVQLCATNDLERPSVIGFFAPRILIPKWLLTELTREELDQIILHETEHLRRGDDWTNFFQKVVLVLFPLNPALLWLERQLCLERELACDEGVIRVTHAPRAYASCLTSLAERGIQHRSGSSSLGALSLGAWQRRPELVRRVQSILLRKQALRPFAAQSLLTVLGCGLLFGSVELSRCPQLIAFIPATDSGNVVAQAPSAHRIIPAETSNADYSVAPRALSIHAPKRSLPMSFLTQLKATAPASDANPSAVAGMSEATTGRRQKALQATLRQSSFQQSPLPYFHFRQGIQSGKLSGAASDSDYEQHWVVLTTWEHVQTAEGDLNIATNAARAEPLKPVDDADSPDAQPNDQDSSHVTFTRLIFRVMPANFTSPPPAFSVRNGWLVIQL